MPANSKMIPKKPGHDAVFIVLLTETTNKIATVIPDKNLPRPFKDGSGKMTKGMPKPRELPGGKREGAETAEETMKRELQEETGIILDTINATLKHTGTIPEAGNARVYLYTVPEEIPITAGEGINKAEWVPATSALEDAHYKMERGLFVTGGPLYRINHNVLTLNQPEVKKEEPLVDTEGVKANREQTFSKGCWSLPCLTRHRMAGRHESRRCKSNR
jgi:8-oxo-dGTP pyrophosphatase MutT (NUDIX family)